MLLPRGEIKVDDTNDVLKSGNYSIRSLQNANLSYDKTRMSCNIE